MSVQVTLPDGSTLQLSDHATGADAAAAIGSGLARAALLVEIADPAGNDPPTIHDLGYELPDNSHMSILTAKNGGKTVLQVIRHDAAHVLATAVKELYPGVKISIGPAIENGFYHDFDFPDGVAVTDSDLPVIEACMAEHIQAAEPFERRDVTVTDARRIFTEEGQIYKLDLLDRIVDEQQVDVVSLYVNGPLIDLCRGPHAPTTRSVRAFRLQSIAGAYWRGDSSRKMLTRIYGTAFHAKTELAEHLERLAMATRRDHRKLGRDLDLFFFSEFSPGAPMWKPAGAALWNALTDFWRRENLQQGYQEVRTPILYDAEIFRRSGHWEKYKDHMFVVEDDTHAMSLKPMSCPAHIQIFKDALRSHRELPIRFSEAGLVHRDESSGVLHGLMRVRHITQDDAHIFCTEDQVQNEVMKCLQFGLYLYDLFDFKPNVELSTRPTERIGSDETWDRAESALERALQGLALDFAVSAGDGAFYGPKIDLHLTDSLGRPWQLGSIQLDYAMPERFDLLYSAADNTFRRPVMIHRALMGSFERFIGILIEHYGGDFPVWLAPVQAIVLPVVDALVGYGLEVSERLRVGGIRAELDDSRDLIGRKIRNAELRKIPYMLIVGKREAQERTVSIRCRQGDDQKSVLLSDAVDRIPTSIPAGVS
jgi:threonyl-tRNA synthetase